MASKCGFPHTHAFGTQLAISTANPSLVRLENAMKFETLMLHSLFASCLAICVATMAAMLV